MAAAAGSPGSGQARACFYDPPTIPYCSGVRTRGLGRGPGGSGSDPGREFEACSVPGRVPDRLMGSHGSVSGDRPRHYESGESCNLGPGT